MFPRPLKGSVCPPALHTHTHTLLCVFAFIGWVCFPIVCRSCSGRTTLAQSVQCSAALLQPVVRQTPALFGDSPASFIPLALPPPVLPPPPPSPLPIQSDWGRRWGGSGALSSTKEAPVWNFVFSSWSFFLFVSCVSLLNIFFFALKRCVETRNP